MKVVRPQKYSHKNDAQPNLTSPALNTLLNGFYECRVHFSDLPPTQCSARNPTTGKIAEVESRLRHIWCPNFAPEHVRKLLNSPKISFCRPITTWEVKVKQCFLVQSVMGDQGLYTQTEKLASHFQLFLSNRRETSSWQRPLSRGVHVRSRQLCLYFPWDRYVQHSTNLVS